MTDTRLTHLRSFYSLLSDLSERIGGPRKLADCSGRLPWPSRGVYFFMENGQHRSDSGVGPRIVRVGTHALKGGAATSLWGRLSQHRGTSRVAGGNHRGSIFRLLVGTALMTQRGIDLSTWGQGANAAAEIRRAEAELEAEVSAVIGRMPFLWLSVDDDAGPGSLRGYIERNAIALLSNFAEPALDPPEDRWLGLACNRDRVRRSGLWNSNHVDETYDPAFLARLGKLIARTARVA